MDAFFIASKLNDVFPWQGQGVESKAGKDFAKTKLEFFCLQNGAKQVSIWCNVDSIFAVAVCLVS